VLPVDFFITFPCIGFFFPPVNLTSVKVSNPIKDAPFTCSIAEINWDFLIIFSLNDSLIVSQIY
jgi:hypothetical protein